MTIVASVKVQDGLVLGTDSMVQMYQPMPLGPQLVKSYDHAQKLFQIRGRPIGAMIYGAGNIEQRSVASLITEFNRMPPPQGDGLVEDVAKELLAFIRQEHEKAYNTLPVEQRPIIGVVVGGYTNASPWAEEWEFLVPGADAPEPMKPAPNITGAAWRGHGIPFTRLVNGIDGRLLPELERAGLRPEQIRALVQKYPIRVMFDGMAVQEAIDYVAFILKTTIDYAKFEVGAPICGGPLWVAVITPQGTFDWVKKHELRVP